MQRGSFEYIYDYYATLEASGAVPYSLDAWARLVGVLGRSEPKIEKRDAASLRGLCSRSSLAHRASAFVSSAGIIFERAIHNSAD